MCRILQNSVRGKLKHTLPLNQKKNLLLLNTISNPAAVTSSPSGISDKNHILPARFDFPVPIDKFCEQILCVL